MNKSNLSLVISLLCALWLVVSSVFGIGQRVVTERVVQSDPSFGAINNLLTTITNPFNFTQGVNIGSSSPSTNLLNNHIVLGLANATSTIFVGKLCIATQGSGGGSPYLFYYPATTTGNAQVTGWATSTAPCY